MLGLDRDSYYEAFSQNVSAVAVEPIDELRAINMPMNTLSTAKEHMTTMPSRGHARISMPDPSELRQQHNYEVLVEPAYRVDLQLANDDLEADCRTDSAMGRPTTRRVSASRSILQRSRISASSR